MAIEPDINRFDELQDLARDLDVKQCKVKEVQQRRSQFQATCKIELMKFSEQLREATRDVEQCQRARTALDRLSRSNARVEKTGDHTYRLVEPSAA